MKKILAAILSLVIVSAAFAQDKPAAAPATPSANAEKGQEMKKENMEKKEMKKSAKKEKKMTKKAAKAEKKAAKKEMKEEKK